MESPLDRLSDPLYWLLDLVFDKPLTVAAAASALGIFVAFRMIG